MTRPKQPSDIDQARRAFLRGQVSRPGIVIAATCLADRGVTCRACEEICEPRAISFVMRIGGPARPRIDTTQCTRCGECVPVCPAAAIAINAPDTGAMPHA